MRLVDASIWIAFFKIGQLDLLLKLPDLAISARVLRELEDRPDYLTQAVPRAIDGGAIDLVPLGDVDTETLTEVLLAKDGKRTNVSEADAEQLALAATSQRAVLYMCDRNMRNLSTNVDIRPCAELINDMVDLHVVDLRQRHHLLTHLRAYYESP